MTEAVELGDDFTLAGLTPRRGRKPLALAAEFSRELTEADLLAPVAHGAIQAKPLAKIRDSHHGLARVLATGVREAEASAITGFSLSRISVLKADPQFRELLEFYRDQGAPVVADFRERMAGMGLDAIQELHERMLEQPEEFTPALLLEVTKIMADRTGHAPQRGPTSVTQINVELGDRMQRARERVANLGQQRVIDHEG